MSTSTAEGLLLARKILDRIRELERLKAFRKHRPATYQKEIHDLLKEFTIVLFLGANGTGKTTTGIAEAVAWVEGFRPWDDTVTRKPPTEVLIVGPDFKGYHVHKSIPIIKMLRPVETWARIDKYNGVETHFVDNNGSTLTLMTYEQHLRKSSEQVSPFEGIDWDFVFYDEPPPRGVWIATQRGVMKKDGKALLGLTPIMSEDWIHDEIYQPAVNGDIDMACRVVDIMETREETEDHPDGIMSEHAIGVYRKLFEHDDHAEARLHGRFVHLQGLILPEYNRALGIHRFDHNRMVIEPNWPKFMVIDPHDRRPWAMCWGAVNPKGQKLIIEEWPRDPFNSIKDSHMGWKDYVNLIEQKEAELPGGAHTVVWRIGDPRFTVTPKGFDQVTLADYLSENDIHIDVDVDNRLKVGHRTVREALKYDTDKPIKENENYPLLRISDECWNMDNCLTHYVWETHSRDDGTKIPKETPSEKFKDFIDLLRYMLQADLTYFDVGERAEWSAKHMMRQAEAVRNYGMGSAEDYDDA